MLKPMLCRLNRSLSGSAIRLFTVAMPPLPSTAIPLAAALPPSLTPALLHAMDSLKVAQLGRELGLASETIAVMLAKGVHGRDLLAMRGDFLERIGLYPGDALTLQHAVDLLRFGGPKTVQLVYPPSGETPAYYVRRSFLTPQELKEFLKDEGVMGLTKYASTAHTTELSELEDGEEYIVDFHRGSLASDMDRVMDATATDAKVVIENAKRAVEGASLDVFGQALTADPRNDILLRSEGQTLGNVDCLFTGPSLHLLLERKRRLGKAHNTTAAVIAQIAATRKVYMELCRHVVGGTTCRVESMVFAESLSVIAQQEFLAAGIYVLHQADMRIQAPL